MMKRLTIILIGMGVLFVSCAKKPEPTPPPPPPIVEREFEPVPEPEGSTAAELLARRIQDLLNQILNNKVYFDFDKSTIKPEGREILSEVGRLLMDGDAGKSITVTIEGHTDEKGTEEYNMALGERRARVVMEYLEGYGVGSNRLTLVSFGEEKPAVVGDDEKNRRSEFRATANVY